MARAAEARGFLGLFVSFCRVLRFGEAVLMPPAAGAIGIDTHAPFWPALQLW
jgi:hypothetical protein